MKKLIIVATLGMAAMTAIVPAQAQVYDWIGGRIDSHRYKYGKDKRSNRNNNTTRKTRARKTQQRKVIVRHPRVQVNGKPLQSSAAPIQRGGQTFVPIRGIFEALGATTTYDSENRIMTARGSDGSRLAQMTLDGGDPSKMENASSAVIDNKSFVYNGVTMVPLRFISEQLGAQVTYTSHPTTPLISITRKAF